MHNPGLMMLKQLDDLHGFYFLSVFYDLFELGRTDTEPDPVCYYTQCVGGQITGWDGKKIQQNWMDWLIHATSINIL